MSNNKTSLVSFSLVSVQVDDTELHDGSNDARNVW